MQPVSVDMNLIRQWIADKLDPQKVEQDLRATGLDEEKIKANLQAFKKEKIASRQFSGFIFLAAGALLGFISCVLSIINPIPALYDLILFGLTSVAILLICLGLYKLFE